MLARLRIELEVKGEGALLCFIIPTVPIAQNPRVRQLISSSQPRGDHLPILAATNLNTFWQATHIIVLPSTHSIRPVNRRSGHILITVFDFHQEACSWKGNGRGWRVSLIARQRRSGSVAGQCRPDQTLPGCQYQPPQNPFRHRLVAALKSLPTTAA